MNETKRSILFLHPAPGRYGTDVALLTLVRNLDRSRWQAVVAVPQDGSLVAALRDAGAVIELGPMGTLDSRVLRSPLRLLGWALTLPRVARFVRGLVARHRPALVHSNSATVLGAALAVRATRAPHLWHLHEIITSPRWAARRLARLAARVADVVVSNSGATRAWYDTHSKELAARHRVVHNGVDLVRLAPQRVDREAARRELDVPAESPLIVLVGRINTWKGQGLLLEAAARLRFRHPDASFLLVGDPPPGRGQQVVKLRDEIQRQNLTGYVRHVPHVVDIARLYVAADIVVVPSTQPEPFGLAAAEAMACGKPVVAADHGGVVEVVEAGRTGLLFPPRDVDKLAWALQVLIEDRARAREMGRRGEARQREHFSAEGMARAMDRIWSRLAQRSFSLLANEAHIVHFAVGAPGRERSDEALTRAERLAAAQAARGLEVELVVLTPHDWAAATASPLAPPYPLQRFALGRKGRLPAELRPHLDALPAHALAHLHGSDEAAITALARDLARRHIPYVITCHRHAGAAGAPAPFSAPERRTLRAARAIHALSEAERTQLAAAASDVPIVYVPLGQEAFGQWDVPRTSGRRRPVFGFQGPLSAEALGLDALLDAFAMHVAGGGEGSLELLGDGVDRGTLESRAAELGIARRVKFAAAPLQTARWATLADWDIAVDPARCQDFAAGVLEAAALGKPLVVTRASQLEGLVRAYGAGFTVERADPALLAATLAACEREWREGTLDTRGEAARLMVAQNFPWDQVEPALRNDLYGIEAEDTTPTTPLQAAAPSALRRPA